MLHNERGKSSGLCLQARRSGRGSRTGRSPLRAFDEIANSGEAEIVPSLANFLLTPGQEVQQAAARAIGQLMAPLQDADYVGMAGLTPEERFANDKNGDKASSVVKRYGIRLLPELYAHLNPMPFDAAVEMEQDLAEDLRRAGFTVAGGH